jgi:hypothetical protein
METVDDETVSAALKFIDKAHRAGRPFYVWWNGTRMHFRTHVKDELRGISGQDEYADGMVEHDMHVGQLLKKLDDLGITNLRRDPYERAHVTSNIYHDWMIDRVFFLVPAQAYVADFLQTFREFPPRQKPASFTIDQVMKLLEESGGSK